MTGMVAHWLPGLVALLIAGLMAGFAAGLFGIGGGFVVVPALIALLPVLGGAPAEYAHVAIGTSLATIVFTSLRSVQAHARRGAVDFDILKSWAPWIVLGVGAGILLARMIDGRGLTLIFAGGVFLMALHFIAPWIGDRPMSDRMPTGVMRASIAGGLGTFSSLLGIGGGTIAVVVMTLCGRSIHRAIATAAGLGFVIAVPGTIGFVIIGLGVPDLPMGSLGYVNVPGAAIIACASMLTAPLGAAAAHSLPAAPLKRVFGLYLLFVSVIMFRNAWF